MYKRRNDVERLFRRLKGYRRGLRAPNTRRSLPDSWLNLASGVMFNRLIFDGGKC